MDSIQRLLDSAGLADHQQPIRRICLRKILTGLYRKRLSASALALGIGIVESKFTR